VLRLAGAIAAAMLEELFANYFTIFLCILLLVYLKNQHQRYSEFKPEVYSDYAKSFREIAEKIVLTGLTAGFVAGFLVVLSGISIEAASVKYLLLGMIILIPFDLRYANISYAAGALALVSLIFGHPRINIPSLAGLVAILHLIEGILIFMGRKDDFLPVFIKHGETIAGAYLIKRFWIVPVVFITYMLAGNPAIIEYDMSIPGLFRIEPAPGAFALALDCTISLLSYSDIAVTRHPEKKCAESAVMISGYGLVMLILSVLSQYYQWMVYICVAVCLLGYEAIHFFSKVSELGGEPLYSPARRGLRVMDILPGSHAEKMGLMRGDIILSINNNDIQTDAGVAEALKDYPTFAWIRVLGWDGNEREIEYRCYPDGFNSLGIVSVPREQEVTYSVRYFESINIIRNIVKKFKGIDSATR